ncbi:hypothetical protein bcgnr5372_37370 [Bacillus luti]|nr:hypothetical protein [Bacillus cereus]HDR8330037.1 hypothetical protein [Bacillus cereus]HDR8337259.1 hypothetical protein [Bacillus cereus]
MQSNSFQRADSISNAHVGAEFEKVAKNYFSCLGIELTSEFKILVGVASHKKERNFDLGCDSEALGKVLVECKSHKWTAGGNVPSAKITVWNEAMYYFLLAPSYFRKVFFVLRDFSEKKNESLAEYYVRTHRHLIPDDVEILEYCQDRKRVQKVL